MIQTVERTADLIPSRQQGVAVSDYQAVMKVVLSDVEACLGIRTREGVLATIEVLGAAIPEQFPLDPLAAETVEQLRAYFRDPRWRLSLPLFLAGTSFQRRVWEALKAIPSGQTRTYGELARQVGGGPRAVGGACRLNPLPIVIPCHRVVSTTGLGGYMGETSGAGLVFKANLLAHERQPAFLARLLRRQPHGRA